jgi:hypothetical protein
MLLSSVSTFFITRAGANPTIVSYTATTVKICNTKNNLVRSEDNFFLLLR